MPAGEFLGKGNYAILRVRKIELTTWDMIAIFAEFLQIEAQKIGYAGLKDKHATTTQYISFESKYERELRKFSHPQISVLSQTRHSHSIRMGDLRGNRFSINLHGVDAISCGRIEKTARKISKNGLPNYFGYQRFGRDKDSIAQAKEMVLGDLFIEDDKVKSFLFSIYQSQLFNLWLQKRVLLSMEKSIFTPMVGDVYVDKKGEFHTPKIAPLSQLEQKKLIPTGLLCGRDAFRAKGEAAEIEREFDDEFVQTKGYRRDAVVYPAEIECKFVKAKNMLNISFMLPKGSYATVFLEAISGQNYTAESVKSPLKPSKAKLL